MHTDRPLVLMTSFISVKFLHVQRDWKQDWEARVLGSQTQALGSQVQALGSQAQALGSQARLRGSRARVPGSQAKVCDWRVCCKPVGSWPPFPS